MKRKTLIISISPNALLLLVVFIFQGMVFPYIRIAGFSPLLLPLVGTGIAVHEGRVAGGIAGIFAGFLCDLSLNEPVGLFTVLLTFSGLIVGTLADSAIRRGFVTYFILCIGVLIISALVQMLPLIYFGNVAISQLMPTALWQTVYSMIFAVPIWFSIKAIGKRVYRESYSGRPR